MLAWGEKVKLTKMTDLPTNIVQAVQQAFIIVDEEGTVAGAVTGGRHGIDGDTNERRHHHHCRPAVLLHRR